MKQGIKTIAIPPGETIREQLENRGMIQKEFAIRMDMTEKHISHLLNGKVSLTIDVALRLEDVLGIPAKFWMNLEALYREDLARVDNELQMESDCELAKHFPYSEAAKKGWLPKTSNIKEKVKYLRQFFEVSSLSCLENLQTLGIAYRISGDKERDYTLALWAQKAKLEARKISTSNINIQKLTKKLYDIRKLTLLNPEEFFPILQKIFSDCGIALVALEHLKGSYLHGATFNDGNKIVLGITVRGCDADKFWFSLFHEIHHIIVGDINYGTHTTMEQEAQADSFARDILIPGKEYEMWVKKSIFSKENVLKFAESIGIAAGIVVGRLQKDSYIGFNRLNGLKQRYEIVYNE